VVELGMPMVGPGKEICHNARRCKWRSSARREDGQGTRLPAGNL